MFFDSIKGLWVTDAIDPYYGGNEVITAVAVIMDMTWMRHYDDMNVALFRHFPLRIIIEAIASLPLHYDFELFLFESFYGRLDLTKKEPEFELTLRNTIDELTRVYFMQLEKQIPGTGRRYLFGRWTGKQGLILIREDYWRLRNLGSFEIPK